MKRLIVGVFVIVFSLSGSFALAQVDYCEGNFDYDEDVDGTDAAVFKEDFGRSPFFNPCPVSPCPVRCEGTLSAGGRWCDQGDGTVKDMTNGLVWLKKADWGGLKPWANCSTWDDAHTRAGQLWDGSPWEGTAGLSDGSVEGDWRLPTKTELYGLANGTEAVRSDNMRLFTGVQPHYYWSSTTNALSTGYAWDVSMYYGSVNYYNKGSSDYVWPVREGQ